MAQPIPSGTVNPNARILPPYPQPVTLIDAMTQKEKYEMMVKRRWSAGTG